MMSCPQKVSSVFPLGTDYIAWTGSSEDSATAILEQYPALTKVAVVSEVCGTDFA